MAARRGIRLLDLLPNAPGSALIPADFAEQLGALAVLDYQTMTTDTNFIYHGTIQSIADMGLPSLRNWPVQAPGLNTGLPFQLMVMRVAPSPGQNLEPAGTSFRLDLFLDQVAITIPGLRPATLVPSAGTTPAHLVPDTKRQTVRIVGGGVLRISSTNGGPLDARFIDQPDPFNPMAPNGPVFSLTFDPPSFYIGGADIGLTVDRLTYDDSLDYTPPEIEARGHDPSWRGISIKEATLYLPRHAPMVGDLSIGVHDVLLGSPFGLQGSIQIELGQDPVNPNMVDFYLADGTLLAKTGSGSTRQVTLPAGTSGHFQVRGHYNSVGGQARWVLPGSDSEVGADTPLFAVVPGDSVRVSGLEVVGGDTNVGPAVTFQFVEASAANPPQIDVTDGTHTWADVTSLSGRAADLQGLTFQSNPSHDDAVWLLDLGPGAPTGRGSTFTPVIPTDAGTHWLGLHDNSGKTRRLKIDVLEDGDLLIGCKDGVFDHTGATVAVRDVEQKLDLSTFHISGDLRPAEGEVTVSAGAVSVPGGLLARVTVERGAPDNPHATPAPQQPPQPQRRLQILMDFASDHEIRWGDYPADPANPGVAVTAENVQAWANQFPGAEFYVIGRTDELGSPGYDNKQLGRDRAKRGADLLGSGFTIRTMRSEQDAPAATESGQDFGVQEWLIKTEHPEYSSWANPPRDNGIRERYRRVDIYAVGGTPASTAPTTPDDEQTRNPALRRVLVPGADTGTPPAAPTPEPHTPFRVRLLVTWDSPTVVELADAIPTVAELTVAWQSHPVPLPGTSQTIAPDGPPPVYTVVVRWSYDPRSGETVVSVALDAGNDNILPPITSDLAAVAMGLGPAMIAFMDALHIDGDAVRIAGLVGASAVISTFANNGKIFVHGVQVEHKQKSLTSLTGVRERILLDYSVQLGFDVHEGPIQIRSDKPMRVRYKNVGAEFDDSKTGLDKLGLVYDNAAFEIEDPGQWTVGPPLGDLLRINNVALGHGSTWVEVDLSFALDLGIIEISGATIRVTFGDGGIQVELRGLAAGVSIPGTLEGHGRVNFGNGAISAGLDLAIIPAKIAARGFLDMDPAKGFVAIGAQVVFAVGIPLANTGLGIFGFMGQFASNGKRNLTANPDPIQQEIDWYRKPSQKYVAQQGQWALGLGAVIGTLPDTAYTFNAGGMFVVCFPDPTVIFGIDAHFLSQAGEPTDSGSAPTTSLQLLGLLVVDSTALKLGIRGQYEIPKVLQLKVPISAYFPFDRSKGSYLRIGSDGVTSEGRYGDPVQVTILPGTLDVNAWAFFMIEEKQLHKLGGDPDLNLDGFSIGFGAGFGINWSAGPISLKASAKLLVGVGTRPLMLVGKISVQGELSLVVIDISAYGYLMLKLTKNSSYLHGQFCGEVDCFFFSIKGCVGVSIGSDGDPTIPDADSPLQEIVLTERFGRVTGHAATSGSGDPVWPDTIPVLKFKQFMVPGLPASPWHVTPSGGIPGPAWGGTTELKYAYKLTGVVLHPVGGTAPAGPLEAAWWLPSHRSGVMPADPADAAANPPAGEQDGRALALMSWQPAPWSRNLLDGGAGTPADPAKTVGSLCDPTPAALEACVIGETAVREGVSQVKMVQEQPGQGAFPSNFALYGTEGYGPYDMAALSTLAAEYGLQVLPGGVRPLPVPFQEAGHPDIPRVYEIPMLGSGGTPTSTVQFTGQIAPSLDSGSLTLAYCPVKGRTTQRTLCHDYQRLKPGRQDSPLTVADCRYETLDPRQPLAVGSAIPGIPQQLAIGPRGFKVTLPQAADSVTITAGTLTKQPIAMVAYNSANQAIGKVASTTAPKTVGAMTITAAGIAYVIVSAGMAVTGAPNTGVITQFCYTVTVAGASAAPTDGDHLIRAIAQRPYPQVFGVHPGGKQVEWQPKLIREPGGNSPCGILRYFPPEPGPWVGVVIMPFPGAKVGILELCGVTSAAHQAQQADQNAKNDLKDAINTHVVSLSPDGRPLLAANTAYQVDVSYRWVGWRKTDSQQTPPDINSVDWNANPERTETYYFRTAAEVIPAGDPADFYKEDTFDPRAVQRYILGFEPDGKGAPHFLDDPLQVHFAVDYPKQLLGLYGRDLKLKLQRTDPPAGSLAGSTGLPNLPFGLTWGKLANKKYLTVADQRIIDAAAAAPCLQEPDMGGATATINAALEPDAEYDLLVVAPKLSGPADEIVIARCHFRTSHYHGPAELLASMGLTNPNPTPALPHDFLITGTGSVPTAALPASDRDLQQALTDIGMDPWPLPTDGRVVTIWKNQGGWKLVGVLAEAIEAMQRGQRLTITDAAVGMGTLHPVRTNASGSRILLAPSTPITVGPTDRLVLHATNQDGTTLTGIRCLAGGPRILYQEGLS